MSYIGNIPTPPMVLSQEEQQIILKVTGEYAESFRDHMIIAMSLGTGLREHELAALTVGDIFGADGTVRTKVILKTFKRSSAAPAPQEVAIPPRLKVKLKRFIGWKKKRGQALSDEAPLFESKKKNALSTRAMRSMFRKWQDKAGIEQPYTFHALRHTACDAVQRKKKDLRLTQRFARHKSPITTQRYTHPTFEDLAEAVHDMIC